MDTLLKMFLSIISFLISCVILKKFIILLYLSCTYIIAYVYDAFKPRKLEKDVKYQTPLVTFIFITVTVVFFFKVVPLHTNFGHILLADTLISIFFYIGMHRTYHQTPEKYELVVKINKSFSKLCFAPITLFITCYGFLLTVTGLHISEWRSFILYYVNGYRKYADIISNYMLSGLFRSVTRKASFIIGVSLSGYLLSLPKQLLAYMVLQTLSYFDSHAGSYKELIRSFKWKMRKNRMKE